jgi:DNA-binding XRE family transcriptional regulator
MRQWYYVRNLAKAQKRIGKTNAKFAALLGVSFATLRKIKKGKPVSSTIANRIQRQVNRRQWNKSTLIEQPKYILKLSIDPKIVRYCLSKISWRSIDPGRRFSSSNERKCIHRVICKEAACISEMAPTRKSGVYYCAT